MARRAWADTGQLLDVVLNLLPYLGRRGLLIALVEIVDVRTPVPRLQDAGQVVHPSVQLGPQAVACGTGAVRIVEGEDARTDLRIADAAVDTGQPLGEDQILRRLEEVDGHNPLAELQRGLQRI